MGNAIDAKEATPAVAEIADATPVRRLALRDGGIALAALSLWAAADAWRAVTGLTFATPLSALNGAVAGYLLGRMAHEWGHFAGARLAGGIAPTRPIDSIFTFFDFDLGRSSPASFRAMGIWGNVGHWAAVLLLLSVAPLDSPGRIALPSGAFAFAFSASLTELPVIRRAYAGASAADSFRGLTLATVRRDRLVGAGAGLLLFALIAI